VKLPTYFNCGIEASTQNVIYDYTTDCVANDEKWLFVDFFCNYCRAFCIPPKTFTLDTLYSRTGRPPTDNALGPGSNQQSLSKTIPSWMNRFGGNLTAGSTGAFKRINRGTRWERISYYILRTSFRHSKCSFSYTR